MKPKLLTTLRGYDGRQFAADAAAGVTVAMVALPLSIAIAIASGATPAAGLVTAVIGGFLISALGGSRVQIGGPTGAFIVVVYGVIEAHGFDGLLLATLMAGIILVIAGLLRAGRLIALIPEAVIEGFTIGIAIVIATSQLKDLFGLSTGPLPADFLEKLPMLWEARGSVSMPAAIIGFGTIAAIFALRHFAPKLPGSMLVVVAASVGVALLAMSVDSVGSRYGALPHGLPWPSLPPLTLARIIELLPSALVIAFLAGVESLLSALVADRMIGGAHRSNAELLAQGAANIASPLFGGLPATGALARTAVNARAGGRTPVAGIVHAIVILMVMAFAAPLAAYLAMPALAGLLLVTAWTMSEPDRWPERWRAPRGERFLLLLTLLLTVFSDLTVAIAVGTAVGLALRLARRGDLPSDWTPPER
jgi:sulfate permease, SulP family